MKNGIGDVLVDVLIDLIQFFLAIVYRKNSHGRAVGESVGQIPYCIFGDEAGL